MKNKIFWSCSFVFVGILGIGVIAMFYLRAELSHQKLLIDQKTERQLKQILFSQVDCTAPCWRGLEPGQFGMDTYQHLADELEKTGFILRSTSDEQKNELYDGQAYTSYSWLDAQEELYFYIYIDAEGKVRHVYFSTLSPTSLDSLFTILDEPDYYISEYGADIHAYVTLVLLYIEEGVVIYFQGIDINQLTDDCHLHLSDLQTIEISLVEPTNPIDMLKDALYASGLPLRPVEVWTGQDAIQVQGCAVYKSHR